MNSRERIFKALFILTLALFIISVNVSNVHADTGAKPSITLRVENAPQDYYVALLDNWLGKDGQNSELKLDEVNDETVKAYLESFIYDGWYMFDNPVGKNIRRSNPENEYDFGYMVPDPFRVIVISTDGTVYISEVLDQKEFNADCTYDVATGTLTEERGAKVARRIIYIAICYILTLCFELIVLVLFKYPLNLRNIICFLLINTLTNIPFNCYIMNSTAGLPVIVMGFFLEILIILVEGFFYAFTLRDAEGNMRFGKSFLYGVVANIFSEVMGIVLLIVYAFITSI